MRRLPTIAVAGVVLLAAFAILAARRAPLSARPGDGDGLRAAVEAVFVPLIVRRQEVARLPLVPTAPPTATPTDTATPTETATPTVTPTPTPACAPLGNRLRVSPVDVSPAEIEVVRGRGWSAASRPVFLSPLPDGGSQAAWSDREGRVHVTWLHGEDGRREAADLEVETAAGEVRGLVAHDDGTALLLGDGDTMTLLRLDVLGGKLFERRLVGGVNQSTAGSKWIDSWGHEGRLVWTGEQYGAYFGHTQMFGAAEGKHQGDLFWLFDADGNKLKGGWDWGCSHSLDLRLAHDGTRFGPVCLSDCYPTKGIHFNYRTSELRREPSGDCSGGSDARLGGLVALDEGFMLTFTSKEGRASADVGMLAIDERGRPGPVMWLTDTPEVDETGAHLARYGSGFLAGWQSGSSYVVANVTAGGAVREGPAAVDARFAARDDWMNFANGDVGWAYAWDDMRELKVVRVPYCVPE